MIFIDVTQVINSVSFSNEEMIKIFYLLGVAVFVKICTHQVHVSTVLIIVIASNQIKDLQRNALCWVRCVSKDLQVNVTNIKIVSKSFKA